jgi:hypothetical protein
LPAGAANGKVVVPGAAVLAYGSAVGVGACAGWLAGALGDWAQNVATPQVTQIAAASSEGFIVCSLVDARWGPRFFAMAAALLKTSAT